MAKTSRSETAKRWRQLLAGESGVDITVQWEDRAGRRGRGGSYIVYWTDGPSRQAMRGLAARQGEALGGWLGALPYAELVWGRTVSPVATLLCLLDRAGLGRLDPAVAADGWSLAELHDALVEQEHYPLACRSAAALQTAGEAAEALGDMWSATLQDMVTLVLADPQRWRIPDPRTDTGDDMRGPTAWGREAHFITRTPRPTWHHEIARRYSADLTDEIGVPVQVTWSADERGDQTWTVTWTDGPPADRDRQELAEQTGIDLAGSPLLGRVVLQRELSVWAWLWALRELGDRGDRGVYPTTAQQALDLVAAQMPTLTVPAPAAGPEADIAAWPRDQVPLLDLAEFVLSKASSDSVTAADADRLNPRTGTRDEITAATPTEPDGDRTETRDAIPGRTPADPDADRTETRDETRREPAGGRTETRDVKTGACARCGQPVPARSGPGRTARYCSTLCRQAAHRDRQREGTTAPLRTCGRCGSPLDPAGSGRPARWCSDACRVAAYRARRKPDQISTNQGKR